jgi:hypothetical protein
MHVSKTALIALVITVVSCLILANYCPVVQSQASQGFTVPCSIATYGDAWNGELAFPLQDTSNNSNYLVVMDTSGNLLNLRESNAYPGSLYNIATNELLFQGEPGEGGSSTAPLGSTHIWNFVTNTTTNYPDVIGHHDIQYDPVNNTFLTFQNYVRNVNGTNYLFDKIVELDTSGNVLWSWDSYNYIPLSEASPFNETATINGQTVTDFTHANSLDWDYNNSIIYMNCRLTNTFYKINETSGSIIWACGEFGNFTLLDNNGNPLAKGTSLWYGEHDVKEVAPDVFTIFNNDYDNITNPDDCRSSLIEVTLNETSMTAIVNWSWEAPTQYWNSFAGSAQILPNGDWLGDFGDPSHQDPQNKPWSFNNTGAVFVEVNPAGKIVRTYTFPVGWYVYRVEALINVTTASAQSETPLPTASLTHSPSVLTLELAAVVIAIIVAPTVAFIAFKRKGKLPTN